MMCARPVRALSLQDHRARSRSAWHVLLLCALCQGERRFWRRRSRVVHSLSFSVDPHVDAHLDRTRHAEPRIAGHSRGRVQFLWMADVLQYRRFEPMMLIPTRASGHDGPNNPPEPWPGPRPEPVPPEPPPTDPFPLEPEPPAPPPSTPDRRPSRPSRGCSFCHYPCLKN